MNKNLRSILQNAVYAALYVALCAIFQPISFAAVQVRIAEALCILPIFDETAIISVSVGCFLSNLLFSGIIDAIFGTLATFLGLLCIKFIKVKSFTLKMLPTILSNAIIVPFVLRFAFGETMPLILVAISIAVGEIIAIYGIGYILYSALKKLHYWHKKR